MFLVSVMLFCSIGNCNSFNNSKALQEEKILQWFPLRVPLTTCVYFTGCVYWLPGQQFQI